MPAYGIETARGGSKEQEVGEKLDAYRDENTTTDLDDVCTNATKGNIPSHCIVLTLYVCQNMVSRWPGVDPRSRRQKKS